MQVLSLIPIYIFNMLILQHSRMYLLHKSGQLFEIILRWLYLLIRTACKSGFFIYMIN